MPVGSQQGRNTNEANIVRQGLTTAALEDGATSGQVASVTNGELEFVSAGGGSQTDRAIYSGIANTIANGAADRLSWDTLQLGTELLDISLPGEPTIITGGVYAVTVAVSPYSELTAGGWYTLTLELDLQGDDPISTEDSPVATAAAPAPRLAASMTYYIPAGGRIYSAVSNNDGVSAQDFALSKGIIQRIS